MPGYPPIIMHGSGITGSYTVPSGATPNYPSAGVLEYLITGIHDWENPGLPPGTDAFVECWGGGGGGCRGTGGASAGAGGGAGGYAGGTIPSSQIYAGGQLKIGIGGTGTATGDANPGDSSRLFLDGEYRLTGNRGEAGSSDGGGGPGGTANTGTGVVDPVTAAGGDGAAASGATGGAGGDAHLGGVGGAGGVAADGSPGGLPGAGGGGCGGTHTGGNGAPGKIRFTWPPPT